MLITLGLIYLSISIEDLLAKKQTAALTGCFFVLYALCATQDIAVDGWSITLLSPQNAGYSSACNAAGQGAGFFLGMVGPSLGYLSLSEFFLLIAAAFLITTLAAAFFQSEAPTPESETVQSVGDAYSSMLQVCKLSAVRRLFVLLLTRHIAFVPMDEMVLGKLQDSGLSMQSVALLRSVTTPLEFIVPWALTNVPALRTAFLRRPLHILRAAYIPRLLLTPFGVALIWFSGQIDESPSWSVVLPLFALTFIQGICTEIMFGNTALLESIH